MPDVFDATKKPTKIEKRSRAENSDHANTYSSVLRTGSPAGSSFAAYCLRPLGVGFDLQHDDEPVLLMLRQHPIVNIPWILLTILLVLAPILLLPLFPILDFLPANFKFVSLVGWYTMVFGYAFEQFLIWFFNIYIVTDERVIDVDFYNLLFKKVSEAKLENIEDITTSNSGLLQSVIDFGDVRIQTAAEVPEIEFERVPHPDAVQKFLSEMLVQEEQERIEGRVR